MTPRSQKWKALEEQVSRDMETPITEKNPEENPTSRCSKSPKIHLENVNEIQTSLRKEIMSDSNMFYENLTKMLKSIAVTSKTQNNPLNIEDTEYETENVLPTTTSTPVRTKTTTRKNLHR